MSPGLVVVALAIAITTTAIASPVAADGPRGERLLHLPMRWCVLEDTKAARDPNDAVLRRLRRGSKVWARQARVTLRSAVYRHFNDGDLSFPVIRDTRQGAGGSGDVEAPRKLANGRVDQADFTRIIDRCAARWDRMKTGDGEFRIRPKLSNGPIAVIIDRFVDQQGNHSNEVYGYANTVHANPGWCVADRAPIRYASGGKMMVIDTTGRFPGKPRGRQSLIHDRRLVAHEAGHVMKLGHGDGVDDPNTNPVLIDKFCDSDENEFAGGSVMHVGLGSSIVTPWQRLLARHVANKHPATLKDPPLIIEAHEVVGDDAADDSFDVVGADSEELAAAVDIERIEYVREAANGLTGFTFTTRGDITAGQFSPAGLSEFIVFADIDGDPTNGARPDTATESISGEPYPADLPPVDLIAAVAVFGRDDVVVAGWRFDDGWHELDAATTASVVLESANVLDDEGMPSGVTMQFFESEVGANDVVQVQALARTWAADGQPITDTLQSAAWQDGIVPLSLELDFLPPACAVARDSEGVVRRGSEVSLEVLGFDREEAPVTIWFSDQDEPVGEGLYTGFGDNVWETTIPIPADADSDLSIVQVVLDGTAVTAACGVFVED